MDNRYEEALDRAKAGKPMDEVFPELKESEDERIRKMLISLVKHHSDVLEQAHEKEILAYLEKQKEQKPTNSEKPKEWSEEEKKKIANIMMVLMVSPIEYAEEIEFI